MDIILAVDSIILLLFNEVQTCDSQVVMIWVYCIVWPYIMDRTIVRGFDVISLCAHNSSMEGATELKFAPLYSS